VANSQTYLGTLACLAIGAALIHAGLTKQSAGWLDYVALGVVFAILGYIVLPGRRTSLWLDCFGDGDGDGGGDGGGE